MTSRSAKTPRPPSAPRPAARSARSAAFRATAGWCRPAPAAPSRPHHPITHQTKATARQSAFAGSELDPAASRMKPGHQQDGGAFLETVDLGIAGQVGVGDHQPHHRHRQKAAFRQEHVGGGKGGDDGAEQTGTFMYSGARLRRNTVTMPKPPPAPEGPDADAARSAQAAVARSKVLVIDQHHQHRKDCGWRPKRVVDDGLHCGACAGAVCKRALPQQGLR